MAKVDPRDKWLLIKEGARLLDAKQPAAAISVFQKALSIDPSLAGAYSGIGQAFLHMEEFEGAKVAFTKSIELQSPSGGERYVMLGYALEKLGLRREAFHSYRNALQMSPEDSEALLNIGILLRDSHPRTAIAFFARALTADPNYWQCYLELGAVLNRTARFEEAKRYLWKATELMPDSVWTWIELANSLWRTNEKSRAEQVLKDATERFPHDPAPLWTLAAYLEHVGRTDEAEALFGAAVSRQPNDQRVREMLSKFRKRRSK